MAKARLNHDGILAITCPGSLSYIGEELANLNACLYYTMQNVFASASPIPGELNILLASPSAEILNVEASTIAQRFQKRNLKTKLMSDYHIQYKLDETKAAWFLDSLEQVREVRLNRDLVPSGLFYTMSLWSALVSEHFTGVLTLMGKTKLWFFLALLAVFMVLFLALRRRIARLEASPVAIAIVTTGFAGMAFDMVLILAFQSLYGYVYQMIALLTAAFMVGLAIGSNAMTRIMSHIVNDRPLLIKLESVILVFSALVPVVLVVFHSHLSLPLIFGIVQVVILLLSLVSGILVGAEFPLANKIYLRDTGRVGEVAGALYACDLIGAWVGALVVSIWLIPVIGIINTCILIVSLKVVSLILVVTSRL